MKTPRTSYNRSIQPRKQRKLAYAAPLHIRQKFMSCNLSKELRAKIKKRNLQLRKGDEVKVMRGQFRGKTGTVNKVLLQKTRAHVEGVENLKKDGSKAPYPIHPSNLMIIKLIVEDKKRIKAKKETKK